MAMVKKSVIGQAEFEAQSIEDQIEALGCHQCQEELELLHTVDEGIEKNFCSISCQLKFYQSEYDRLINKNNRISQARSKLELRYDKCNSTWAMMHEKARGIIERLTTENKRLIINYNAVNSSWRNALGELATIYDTAKNGMIETGQKETL